MVGRAGRSGREGAGVGRSGGRGGGSEPESPGFGPGLFGGRGAVCLVVPSRRNRIPKVVPGMPPSVPTSSAGPIALTPCFRAEKTKKIFFSLSRFQVHRKPDRGLLGFRDRIPGEVGPNRDLSLSQRGLRLGW